MVDVRVLNASRPSGQRGQQIVFGTVSTEQPAPSSFTDPLYVTVPSHSSTVLLTFTSWPRVHGTILPSAGCSASIAYDENNQPHVLGWELS